MYTLKLTEEDWQAIRWVGGRYCWSEALLRLGATQEDECSQAYTESEAWELIEAFDADTEGGHSYFPCLDPLCDLYSRLLTFRGAVV